MSFDKIKCLEALFVEVAKLEQYKDNPILHMQKTLELSDFLQKVYDMGFKEGKTIKSIQNN